MILTFIGVGHDGGYRYEELCVHLSWRVGLSIKALRWLGGKCFDLKEISHGGARGRKSCALNFAYRLG